jgi:glycosyltransferase involved in cell wall biosynthesis
MPKVSVIIPTYNRGYIVRQAIESVLEQTLEDFELLIIDDGSTDNTRSVIESLNDHRVRYFYKTNGGPASARNYGLARATGEFIAFLDSDDFWPKNYLEVMLLNLESVDNLDAVYSPVTLVYPDGRRISSYKMSKPKTGKITMELFKSSFIWPFAMLCRAKVWENLFFDENCRVSEDSDAILRLSLCARFGFVADVEAYHRIGKDSLSAQAGVACTRLLTLERFYFRLGGKGIIPKNAAFRKLSHSCRKIAKDYGKIGKRAAALKLYGRAIKYRPFDIRLYFGYMRAALLSKADDLEPEWQMPDAMSEPLGTKRFLQK